MSSATPAAQPPRSTPRPEQHRILKYSSKSPPEVLQRWLEGRDLLQVILGLGLAAFEGRVNRTQN